MEENTHPVLETGIVPLNPLQGLRAIVNSLQWQPGGNEKTGKGRNTTEYNKFLLSKIWGPQLLFLIKPKVMGMKWSLPQPTGQSRFIPPYTAYLAIALPNGDCKPAPVSDYLLLCSPIL